MSSAQSPTKRARVKEATIKCTACNKRFKTRRAADQHYADKHESGSSLEEDSDSNTGLDKLEPPYPGAYGEWVRREQYVGHKSFGRFTCTSCNNHWKSAHAFRAERQGCCKCETMSYPWVMWYNFATRARKASNDRANDPHQKHRCEACTKGICIL